MRLKQREALLIAQHILNMGDNTAKRLNRVIDRIEKREKARGHLLPMKVVLAKVTWPAEDTTLTARAARLGISRQTWYDWINGKFRPNIQQANKLSELTGLTVKQIRGTE
jgi:DNA-binding XRE family transcriptional regulator